MIINQFKANRAFTFIEVAVVVAIIGIVTAITVPTMLDSKDKALADRARALNKLISDACVRAGLDGNSIPASNNSTLPGVIGWYQSNGYIAQSPVIDLTGLDMTMITVQFDGCAGASLVTGGTGTGGTPVSGTTTTTAELPAAPGPVTEGWWDTRRLTVDLPGLSTGAQSLTLQQSSDGQTWTNVASGDAGGATYTAGPFNPDASVYYRVDAVNQYGETAGPSTDAVTAPPLSPPGDISVTGSSTTSLPGVTVPPNAPGGSGYSGGGDSGGGNLSGIPINQWGGGSGGWDNGGGPGLYNSGSSSGLSAPGSINITNLTSTGYNLDLPTLPHDIVTEGATVFDFAWGWMLYSSADGQTWNYNAAWQWASQVASSGSGSQFGWEDSQGDLITNPSPISVMVAPGTTTFYKLVGSDTEGLQVSGQVVSVTSPTGQVSDANVPAAPDVPTVSNISTTSLSVTLPALPAYATSLTLESSNNGYSWQQITTGLAANAVVPETGLNTGATYYYRAMAVNQYGTTEGNMVEATTTGKPGAPDSVTASNVNPTSFTLTMPALPTSADSLTLQVSTDGSTWAVDGTNTGLGGSATVQETGLSQNTTYYYRALAVNQYGSTAGTMAGVTTTAYPSNDVLSIQDATYTAVGTSGSGTLSFAINLAWASTTNLAVGVTPADGSAIAGQDYLATSGTVTIPAGSTSATYNVTTLPNSARLTDAMMTVTISATDSSLTINRISASGDIPAMQQASAAPVLNLHPGYFAATGTDGRGTMTFALTLSASNSVDTTCTVSTQDGSAISGTDYIAESGTIDLPAGQTSTQFTVPVIANPQRTQPVTFSAVLSNPNAVTNVTQAVGIIPPITGGTSGGDGEVEVTTPQVYKVFAGYSAVQAWDDQTNAIQPVAANATLSYADVWFNSPPIYDPLAPIDELAAAYSPSLLQGGTPDGPSWGGQFADLIAQGNQPSAWSYSPMGGSWVTYQMPLPDDIYNDSTFTWGSDAVTINATPDFFAGWGVDGMAESQPITLSYDFTMLAGQVTQMQIAVDLQTNGNVEIAAPGYSNFGDGQAPPSYSDSNVPGTDTWTTLDLSSLIGTAGTWTVPTPTVVPSLPSPADLESDLMDDCDYGPNFGASSSYGVAIITYVGYFDLLDHMILTWAPGVTPTIQ